MYVKPIDTRSAESSSKSNRSYSNRSAKLPSRTISSDGIARVSRSAMVNIEQIKELHPLFHGEYVIILRSGAKVTLTRTYRDKLQQLGLA